MMRLALIFWLCAVWEGQTASLDHFTLSPIASPQTAGAPFPITVSAYADDGSLLTNALPPVQLILSDAEAPALADSFDQGLAGWGCQCAGGSTFSARQYDTDGDGLSDPAVRVGLSDKSCSLYRMLDLTAGALYAVTFEVAFEPGEAERQSLYVDAVTGTSQIGVWSVGPSGGGQPGRATMHTRFRAPEEGHTFFSLRFWHPLSQGGSAAYVDNLTIQLFEVEPAILRLEQGQWTGEVFVRRGGTNLALRVLNHHGQVADSNPFAVLPFQTDVSVVVPDQLLLPAGIPTRVNLVISNAGPSIAEGVWLTNTLPAGMALLSVEPGISYAIEGENVICEMPPVWPGQTAMLEMLIRQNAAADVLFRAALNLLASDRDPLNNAETNTLRFAPVLQGSDVTVGEHVQGTNAVFQFWLTVPALQEIAVPFVVFSQGATVNLDYQEPATRHLLFSAGATQQTLVVAVLDDPFYEPAEEIEVTLSAATHLPVLLEREVFKATILDDEPQPTAQLLMPASVAEDAGRLEDAGTIRLSGMLDRDLTMSLTSSDPARLEVPAELTIAAGKTNASFYLRVIDTSAYEGARTVAISAQSTNGIGGRGEVAITEDDLPGLTAHVLVNGAQEGSGTLTRGFQVRSPVPVATNVTIHLSSSDTSELEVPASVVLPAGQASVDCPVVIIDDTQTDGPQPVTITASAPGFISGSMVFTVRDNEVQHFSVGALQDSKLHNVTSTVPFWITVSARDVASNLLSSFTGTVSLSATGDQGFVALTPAGITEFSRGRWSGQVVITNGPHTNVRIAVSDGLGHTGQSEPFTVFAPPAQTIRIVGIAAEPGKLQFQFNSIPGRGYVLEFSPELTGSPWTPVLSNILGTGEVITTNVPGPLQGTRGFYRVGLQ